MMCAKGKVPHKKKRKGRIDHRGHVVPASRKKKKSDLKMGSLADLALGGGKNARRSNEKTAQVKKKE